MAGHDSGAGRDEERAGIDRRRLLAYGGVAAGLTWVTPVVASSPAAAGPGTPVPGLRLVAVGPANEVWTSDDNGATWSSATTPVPASANDVTTDGGSNWVAVGAGGAGAWYSHDDGDTWQGALGTIVAANAVATNGADNWVIVGMNGAWYSIFENEFFTSSSSTITGTMRDVATDGSGVWLAVGTTSSLSNRAWRSLDNGMTWTEVTAPSGNAPFGIATDGNGTWVAIGVFGAWRSTDNGSTWTSGTGINGSALSVATDGAGRWVAVGSSGRRAWYSTDGLAWTNATTRPDDAARSVTTDGNGTWVAIGDDGVWRSTDGGVNWSDVTTPTTAGAQAVAYARLLP